MILGNVTVQLNTEQAVSEILSNFNTNFIMDVISDSLKNKFRPYNPKGINYPFVFENDFAKTLAANPSFQDEIDTVRKQTYREIIDMICDHYNLTFTLDQQGEVEPDRYYSIAYLMYEIFVADFTPRMMNFFVNLILKNIDSICAQIKQPEDLKTTRESTAYGKKIYVDQKMILISSYMDQVVDMITSIDIPFNTLMTYLTDQKYAAYLSSILQDNGDIYKNHFASYLLNPITKPDMFTNIKLNIQAVAADRLVDPPMATDEGGK